MTLRIKFAGGPLDAAQGDIEALDPIRIFFDDKTQLASVYRRDPLIDELVYIYDPALSRDATEAYDDNRDYYGQVVHSKLKLVEG